MPLKPDQFKALEDIVGSEYISQDAEVQYPYSWRSGLYAPPEFFSPLYEATLLPRTNEEIIKIVRYCNKQGIEYKASSTGWGPYNDATHPGVIKLDLCRMDRIIDIDEKNMFCVVEPGVIQTQLQAELLKLGLCCNQNGAGTQCSASPIVAHCGFGCLSQSGSYGERNQLGLEWITPEGELVRLGSVGQIGQWFCGDGPGPSLRGVIRGNVVPMGGLGVFTKAAGKLYHYAGPGETKLKNRTPYYTPTNLTDNNMAIRIFSFENMDELDGFQEKVGEAELAFEMMGFNRGMTAANRATSNPEYVKLYDEYEAELGDYLGMVMMGGYSKEDLEWKLKALYAMAEEHGGKSFSVIENDKDVAEGYLWRWTRPTSSIREVFRATGCFAGEVGGTDVWRLMGDYIVETGFMKQNLIDRGLIVDDGHPPFTQMIEHGHTGHSELLIRYYPSEKNWDAISREFMEKANDLAIYQHFGVPGHVFGDAAHDLYGPHVMNYHNWLRAFKKAFDPKGVSEGSHHITVKD